MDNMSEYFRFSLTEMRHGHVPEIIPLEYYNHKKSRLRCSIAWLSNLIFGGKVPLEYEEPLIDEQYTDQETAKQLELNPSVAALLTSGRAYADAASIVLGVQLNLGGSLHATVLSLLHQHGFYALSDDPSGRNFIGRLDSQLSVNNPIRASVHQSVIDAFMRAYLAIHFSVDNVTASIRSIAQLSPLEKPRTTEDALLLWISKVCHIVRSRIEKERREKAAQLTRNNGKSTVRLDDIVPVIPLVKDLLADISDGAALATLICHYCPDHLRITDVALRDPLGVADSCFNLEVVKLFSDHLDNAVYFFRLEDLLYMHSSFKNNVLVFLADLFQCLNSAPPLLCSCSRPVNENHILMSASTKAPRSNTEPELTLGTRNGHSASNSLNSTSLLGGVELSGDFSDQQWIDQPQTGTVVVVSENDDLQVAGTKKLFVRNKPRKHGFHHIHHKRRLLVQPSPAPPLQRPIMYYDPSLTMSPSLHELSPYNPYTLSGYHRQPYWQQPYHQQYPPQFYIPRFETYRRRSVVPQRAYATLDYRSGSSNRSQYRSRLLSLRSENVGDDSTCSGSPPITFSPRVSLSSTVRNGTRPTTASSYTVSRSRQFASAQSAIDAGLPVVSLSSSNGGELEALSPRSSSERTTSNSGNGSGGRITWVMLQQQQKQNQAPSTVNGDDFDDGVVTEDFNETGISNRSNSVGSLARTLQIRRQAEQQRRQIATGTQPRVASAGRTRVNDSGTWALRAPRPGNAALGTDAAYATRLEQLNKSLTDLHLQLNNFSSPPTQKPTPVVATRAPVGYQQQPAAMVVAPPQPVLVQNPNQSVVVYPTMPAPGSAAYYQTYGTQAPVPGYPQPGNHFQSTQSLYVPGTTASGRPSAFTAAPNAQQNNQEQTYFVPIAPSITDDSPSSESTQQKQMQIQELQAQLIREAERTSTASRDPFSDLDESLASVINVRRSLSLSALQNRLQPNDSSASLAQPQEDETALAQTDDDKSNEQQNCAFVVGEQVDADELDRRRRQKYVEMTLKRKTETRKKDVLSKRDVEEARKREEIRKQQDEKERRRQEHRLKQQQIYEEYLQRKKQDEEQIELSRAGKTTTVGKTTPTMTKSKSRDAISMKTRTMPKSAGGRLGPVASEHENLAGLASPPGTPASTKSGTRSARPGVGRTPNDSDETASNTGEVATIATAKNGSRNVFKRVDKPTPAFLVDRTRPRTAIVASGLRSAKSCSSLKVNPSVPLRVQPSAKSNRTLVFNAIRDTCLAGGANAKQRGEALQELEKAPTTVRHFVILFRDAGCQYRGLYTFEPDATVIERIHGIGPKTIKNTMIEHFFKYNSGSKRFSTIPTTQHLSVSVDAVSVFQHFWQQRSGGNTATMPRSANSASAKRAAVNGNETPKSVNGSRKNH